jgi:AraC-like DNA-binding protein
LPTFGLQISEAHCQQLLQRRALHSGVAGRVRLKIAGRVGYSDTSTFTAAFKRWMGMPPGEYKRSLGSPERPPGKRASI